MASRASRCPPVTQAAEFSDELLNLFFALVGPTLALVGAGLTYVGLTLALAQALDWPRWCLAIAFHVLKHAPVWRGPAMLRALVACVGPPGRRVGSSRRLLHAPGACPYPF